MPLAEPAWLTTILDDLDPDRSHIRPAAVAAAPSTLLPLPDDDQRIKRARAYLATMPGGVQGSNGSGATYQAACAMVHGFALGETVGLQLLIEDFNPRCVPAWSEAELAHKCRDAANKGHSQPVGYLLARGGKDHDALINAPDVFKGKPAKANKPAAALPSPSAAVGHASGAQPPAEEFLNEADDDPHRIARGFVARYTHPDGATLAFWQDEVHEWAGSHWTPMSRSELDAEVNGTARRHFEALQREYQRVANSNPEFDLPKLGKVTCALVGNVGAAIRQMTLLRNVESPAWIRGGEGPPATELIAARNGLLHLPSFVAGEADAIRRPTPRLFNTNAVAFDLDPDAPEPAEWLRFLGQLWPTDPDSVALLQEWFGYLLTPDTRQQKMLLMIGPRRSGKGTISQVLQSMVGQANCCGPTLSGLAGQYGLSALLGKSVAVIEDARISGRVDAAVVVERMLAISGEGRLNVERKYLDSVDVRLRTRFVVNTNEVPRLTDTSGALASRWCVLRFENSFEGREDTGLANRLLAELPGILLWAVRGWARLQAQGRFTRPESAADMVEIMEESGSPMGTFVKDRCIVGPNQSVDCDDLYSAWVEYCDKAGRKDAGSNADFGRLLRATVAKVDRKRKRTPEGLTTVYRGIRLAEIGETTAADLFTVVHGEQVLSPSENQDSRHIGATIRVHHEQGEHGAQEGVEL